MVILGIDPGFAITGWGVIKKENPKGIPSGQQITPLAYGTITTKAGQAFELRLRHLHEELTKVIKKYQPETMAIEELFFAKNTTTALQVAQARGVILLTAIQANLPIVEFTPLQVKQALTGYGRADKTQMQKMVKTLLNLKTIPKPDDAADALAIAVCATQKSYK